MTRLARLWFRLLCAWARPGCLIGLHRWSDLGDSLRGNPCLRCGAWRRRV